MTRRPFVLGAIAGICASFTLGALTLALFLAPGTSRSPALYRFRPVA